MASETFPIAQIPWDKYRGARHKIIDDFGDLGYKALHERCQHSARIACEFLGYSENNRSRIRRHWKRLGLPLRNDAAGRHFANDITPLTFPHTDIVFPDRLESEADIRSLYLSVTSHIDRAIVCNWDLPIGTKYAELIVPADFHYGAPDMDYARWLHLRDWIATDKNRRWIGLGDYWDLATAQSTGGLRRHALTFDQATTIIKADMEPIADQCIELYRGNHDERIAVALQIEFDPVKRLAEELNIPYGGYCGFVKINVSDTTHHQTYIGYQHHGFGAGSTWGYVFNTMERLASWNVADWIVMAHRHQKAVVDMVKSRIGKDDEVQFQEIPLVAAGSFLKYTGESYAQEKGMRPSSLGAASLHLYLDRHSVHGRA